MRPAAHSASYVVWGTSAGSLGRVIGTVSGSTTAMMAYGHYAGDVITRRAVLAVALGELVGTLVVLYMEHCCRGRVDWLLMALLPNVPPLNPPKPLRQSPSPRGPTQAVCSSGHRRRGVHWAARSRRAHEGAVRPQRPHPPGPLGPQQHVKKGAGR